jgi:hypothetical protein
MTCQAFRLHQEHPDPNWDQCACGHAKGAHSYGNGRCYACLPPARPVPQTPENEPKLRRVA